MTLKNTVKVSLAAAVVGIMMGCNKNLNTAEEVTSFDRNQDVRTQGIVGGTEVRSGDEVAQYIVGVANVKKGFICSGSLVTGSIVMTAAHCLNGSPDQMVITFGPDMRNPVAVRRVTAFQASPKWNPRELGKNAGDIGFMRFEGGLPEGYTPAAMLISSDYIKDGAPVVLAGYGSAEASQSEDGGDDGAMTLRQVSIKVAKANFTETEVLLDQSHGKAACHGDSGGPAYVKAGGQLLLWGVTSRGGDREGNCAGGVLYTNSLAFKSWIAKILNAWDPLRSSNTFRFF